MFADLPYKAMIYLAMLTAVIAGITAGYNAIEQSGYDRAQAELLVKHQDELLSITNDFTEEVEKAKHEAEFFRKQAVLLQDIKPIVVTKIKEKIINENRNCSNINGFSELLNTSIKRFDI